MIVCLHCGDKGFEEALTLCEKCRQYALHRYCLEVLPKDLSKDDVTWFCEDCKPYNSKQTTLDKPSPSSGFSVSVEIESPKKCRSGFMKNENVITASEAKTEVQTDEDVPSGIEPWCREKCDEDQMLRRKRRFVFEDEEDQHLETSQASVCRSKSSNTVEQRVTTGSVAKTEGLMCDGKPFGNDSRLREKCDNEQKLRKEMRLFLDDEEAKPSETSQVSVCPPKPSNTLEQTVFTTCSVAKAEAQMCNGKFSSNNSQCGKESYKDQQLKKGQKTSQCSNTKPSNVLQHKIVSGSMEKGNLQFLDGGPSGNMPQSKERCDNDQKFMDKGKLVLSGKEAKPVKTSDVAASHLRPSNILTQTDITGSVTKTKVQTCDNSPSNEKQQCREKCDKHQKLSQQRKTSQVSDSKPLNISQQKDVTGSVSKTKVQIRDSWPSNGEPQYRSKCNKYQELGKRRKTFQVRQPRPLNISRQKAIISSIAKSKLKVRDGRPYRPYRGPYRPYRGPYPRPYHGEPLYRGKYDKDCDSRPNRGEPLYRGKCYKDQKFRKCRRLLYEDDEDNEPLKTYQADISDPKLSILEQSYYLEAQPVIDRIWKGSLSIWDKDFNTLDRLLVAAHLSNLACPEVFEVARLLPEVISVELSNRSHFWPRTFQNCRPSYHHIALYFFPDNRRDENVFDSLVIDMINQDLAMKAVFEEAELLVFTSYALPMHYRRFQTKHYLWGVFRGRQA